MVEVVGRNVALEQACEELIEAAKSAGSDDNITCLLLRAVEQTWQGRLFGRLTGNNSQQSST